MSCYLPAEELQQWLQSEMCYYLSGEIHSSILYELLAPILSNFELSKQEAYLYPVIIINMNFFFPIIKSFYLSVGIPLAMATMTDKPRVQPLETQFSRIISLSSNLAKTGNNLVIRPTSKEKDHRF